MGNGHWSAERVRREHSDTRLRAEALLAIGRGTASRLREPTLRTEYGEPLYDERGLPRCSSIPWR